MTTSHAITEEFKHRHGRASPAWRRFLEFVEQHPEAARPMDMADIHCRYPVQSWPTFITAQRRQEIAAATVGVFKLLKDIPERIFGMNASRIAAYYKITPRELMPHLLRAPNGLACAIGRGDFIDSDAGFKCVEFNPYANLGGLETEFIAPAIHDKPAFAQFMAATGVHVKFDRVLLALFEYFIREVRAGWPDSNEINIAAIVDDEVVHLESNTARHGPVYAEALANVAPGVRGRLIVCQTAAVVDKDGFLYHGNTRIHVVWELGIETRCPPQFFIPFKSRRVFYYNSPLAGYLGDKRNLGLLSHAAEGNTFNAAEQDFIHRHVPWTREVADIETRYQGVYAPLMEHVRAHRPHLVLKKGFGMKGEQVFIGKSQTPQQWEDTLRIALLEGDWIAQEYLQPHSYLYQHGPQGQFPYQGVWGTFCFGDTYAGAYLRIVPETNSGPINSAQGAMTSVVFEA